MFHPNCKLHAALALLKWLIWSNFFVSLQTALCAQVHSWRNYVIFIFWKKTSILIYISVAQMRKFSIAAHLNGQGHGRSALWQSSKNNNRKNVLHSNIFSPNWACTEFFPYFRPEFLMHSQLKALQAKKKRTENIEKSWTNLMLCWTMAISQVQIDT